MRKTSTKWSKDPGATGLTAVLGRLAGIGQRHSKNQATKRGASHRDGRPERPVVLSATQICVPPHVRPLLSGNQAAELANRKAARRA